MVLSKGEIILLIRQNLGWVANLNKKLHVVDQAYETVSKSFIQQLINTDEWLQTGPKYKPEVFDCDDFAMHLKSRLAKLAHHKQRPYPAALGFMLTTSHAFNFSIGKDGHLVLYDTVNKQVEDRPPHFREFLAFNPGNTVKLLYI